MFGVSPVHAIAAAWVALAVAVLFLYANEYLAGRRKPRPYRDVDLTGKKPTGKRNEP